MNCLQECRRFVVFTLSFVLLVNYASALAPSEKNALVAFSLSAAKRSLSNGSESSTEIHSLGSITRIWAILLGDQNDLIIVGERDRNTGNIYLDDVVVALRTMNKINTGECPGVSIEPVNPNRDSPMQKVIYYGGIDSTHYGKVCYEADLLLKRLSLGFELTGIMGFPSEWDLELHNTKTGRRSNPWEQGAGRSWFFPLHVRIAHNNRCAALTAMTMEVRTDLDEAMELPKEYLTLDEESLAYLIEENPEVVSIAYARLFTQHYDEIASRFPVLIQLQNLLALSGLLTEVLRNDTMQDLEYWMKHYPIQKHNTPKEAPTLSQGVNGVGYSLLISGGIKGIYHIEDARTEAVLSRKPKYLRQAALQSRPSAETVSWIIPIDLEHSQDQTLKQIRLGEDSRAAMPSLDNTTSDNQRREVVNQPLLTPGWHPPTYGKNLVAFSGRLHLSNGGYDQFSPRGKFPLAGTEVAVGVPVSLLWVSHNILSLELTVPLVVQMNVLDIPSRLPGLKENLTSFAGGIANPILTGRIVLLDGIKEGKWKHPFITAENSVTIPAYQQFFDASSGAFDFRVPIGFEQWYGSHGVGASIPISYNSHLAVLSEFQTDWKGYTLGERIVSTANMGWLIEEDIGMSLGIQFSTSFAKTQNSDEAKTQWLNQGHQFGAFLSIPSRNGANTIFIGWYAPNNQPDAGGTFLMSIDLRGTSLWERRTWF